MAHAMASMAGLRGSSQAVLDGSLHITSPNRLVGPSSVRIVVARSGLTVKAQAQQQQPESSRRAMLGLVAAGIAAGSLIQTQAALADARSIPIGPAPAPSGGLPGTLNSDEARDLKLPLNKRFYLQPQTPAEAAQRAKEVAKDIVNVKTLIDKKAWPYVRDDLRLRAEYLRFDLNTVINSKPKDEKKSLKELTNKLFSDLNNLDYAAKIKSPSQAEKYYADTVSSLNDVLSKIA